MALTLHFGTKPFMGIYDVQDDFGAVGDGVTDDTAPIDACFATSRLSYFPPGSYVYNGNGYTGDYPCIYGAGRSQSGIILGAGKSLINRAAVLSSLEVHGLTISGGFGAIRHTYTGSNVGTFYTVRDCDLINYTGCAISSLASDMPNWAIERVRFLAANDTTTIGIALHGSAELCKVCHNTFNRNRVHVKWFGAGCTLVEYNDFIQFALATSNPRTGLWYVPGPSGQSDSPSWIVRNKFGNEWLDTGDYKVLYADEDAASGADFATRFPDFVNPSVGGISQHRYVDNSSSGNSIAPSTSFAFSMTKQAYNNVYGPGSLGGTPPEYILEFHPSAIPTPTQELNNVFGPWRSGQIGINIAAVKSSNDPSGYVLDPEALMTYDHPVPKEGGSNPAGFKKLMATRVNSFTYAGGATRAAITDSIGGTDAVEMVLGSATQVFASIPAVNWNLGVPVYMEFEAKLGVSSPCPVLQFQMRYASNGITHFRRDVTPLAGWRLYRFEWTPIEASAAINFEFQIPSGGVAGSVDIGRCWCYHAYEPQPYPFSYATADLPSAVILGAGSKIWDSTLKKPFWSDGAGAGVAGWFDAAGVVHP